MEKILFTTAFLDIGKKKWNSFQYSNDTYIFYFCQLVKYISYPLVVYVDENIKNIILSQISIPDYIYIRDIHEVDTFYNKFLENEQQIISSSSNKNKNPEYKQNQLEHNYAEYNLINHSKINFVSESKKHFPSFFYYAWIDFGSIHSSIDQIPRNIDFSLLPKNKIIYQIMKNPEHHFKEEDIYFLGNSFIIPSQLVETFEKLIHKKILEWQKKEISDDYPHLFHGIFNEQYNSLYKMISISSQE